MRNEPMNTNPHTRMMFLRTRVARLEQRPPTAQAMEAAETAIYDWREAKTNIDALDDDLLSLDANSPNGCDAALKGLDDAAHAMVSALNECPEAVALVLAQHDLAAAEREYYEELMADPKRNPTR